MKLKSLVFFDEEKLNCVHLGIIYIYLRQELEDGHIIRKAYLFTLLFLHNFLFILHPNHSPLLPVLLSQIPSPVTPFLLREGEAPLGYHPTLGCLVPAGLSNSSPTEA